MKRLLFLLMLLSLIAAFFAVPRVVDIKNLSCRSQFGACSQYLEEKISSANNLKWLESQKKLQQILEDEVYVKDFSQKFVFPDEIVVDVLERKPSVALRLAEEQEFILIDDEGVIVGLTGQTVLPVLVSEIKFDFQIGQRVAPEITFAAKILYQMYKDYNIKVGTMKDDYFEIKIENGPRVIFPLEGDIQTLSSSLEFILSHYPEIAFVSEIDLRFRNPVVK